MTHVSTVMRLLCKDTRRCGDCYTTIERLLESSRIASLTRETRWLTSRLDTRCLPGLEARTIMSNAGGGTIPKQLRRQ